MSRHRLRFGFGGWPAFDFYAGTTTLRLPHLSRFEAVTKLKNQRAGRRVCSTSAQKREQTRERYNESSEARRVRQPQLGWGKGAPVPASLWLAMQTTYIRYSPHHLL